MRKSHRLQYPTRCAALERSRSQRLEELLLGDFSQNSFRAALGGISQKDPGWYRAVSDNIGRLTRTPISPADTFTLTSTNASV